MFQKTLARSGKVTGIGIHTGQKVTMVLHPAPIGSGISFKRVDLDNAEVLKANIESVGPTENNTTLGSGLNSIYTIEHFMAALYGYGVDNLFVEIDGAEVPTMDGSSASFVHLINELGVEKQNALKSFIVAKKEVRLDVDGKWASIKPSKNFSINSTIAFAHPVIKVQKMSYVFNQKSFVEEISRARTFGFLKDVDMLKRKGLIKGGSLNNAIVLDDFRVVNDEGLRFPDEFVRHKVLDTIGDVSLLGHQIIGEITTYKSGHYVHNELCRKLLADPSNYEIIRPGESDQEDELPFKELSLAQSLSL